MATPAKTGTVKVNGTTLYYEIQGSGPTLLFVSGAEGDAAEWAKPARVLADDFTVVSWDRRGFCRSEKPEGFKGVWVDVHADDAAALLEALGLAPAHVWGNSSGAIIGLSLVLRHPEVVRTAMLHEPPLFAGMSDVEGNRAFLKQATANGKAPFIKMLTGAEMYESLPEDYRKRLEDDRTWIDCEFDSYENYKPSDEELAGVKRPVQVLVGTDSPPFFGEAGSWLAERLGTTVTSIPGGHGAHYANPDDVVKAVRDFVGKNTR
jgi:pimeloyl-ACP methyl ester carboxylesterase